jgi:hypothetical protein
MKELSEEEKALFLATAKDEIQRLGGTLVKVVPKGVIFSRNGLLYIIEIGQKEARRYTR